MSRSNGPASQSGGWPPAGRPAGAEQEPQTQSRPQRQPHLIQPVAPQGQQQPYPYAADPNYGQGYGGQAYGAPGHGAQGYAHYDDVPPTGGQGRGDYGQQPGYPPRQAPQQAPSYAPQFDSYVPNSGFPTQLPQSGWEQPAPQQRPAVYPPEAGLSQLNTGRGRPGLGDYGVPPPAADPRARAAEQWPAQPSYQQQSSHPQQGGYPPQYAAEPHEPDLGGYHPQASEAAARGYHASLAEPAFDPQALAYGQEPPFHAQGGLEAIPGQQARYADPGQGYAVPQGYDAQGYDMQAGGYDQHGAPQGGYDEQAQAGEGEEYEDDEPESSGGKWLYIAAALVMAVGVGGGLAYGYQKFIRGGSIQLAAPVVRSDGAPSKIKPAEPGGKQFANRDSKMMDRLSSGSGSSAPANDGAGDSDGGTKRVQTIAIGRDGSMAPPAASPVPPQDSAPAPKPTVSVPGLTVVDGFGRPQPRPAPPETASVSPPAQPIVVSPPAPPAKPVVVARATPAAPTAVDAIEAPAAAAKPVKPAAATVAAVPKLPVPKKPAGPSGAGYVAVLASVPVSGSSQKDSLRQFVDMQSKYGTALQGRTPDVQEVDLGAKGRYHRLLAGPPGSRDAASGVCSQLKAAGYSGCWVIAY